ncbi:MAG: site-specific DNA-methyltransferase [Deferribacterales bacterium]
MAKRKIEDYEHKENLRLNNPHVGKVTPHSDKDDGKKTYAYDPHLSPELQFDSSRAVVENIIADALATGDADAMKKALEKLQQMQQPYLNWAGKAEKTTFEVPTVSLHVHERMKATTIVESIRKKNGWQPEVADFMHQASIAEDLEFYKHQKEWSNRLIAGDSLLVMNSLVEKEGMAGKVQMIYIDPPYGIKYGSNFQPFVNKRNVTDKNDSDLTQEPEMVKAFRDTWELGIHSYLTYLRDRVLFSHELMSNTGSIFVQISDENIHLVRNILDEIYGASNFAGLITFQKTGSIAGNLLGSTVDFVLWYAKDINNVKYNQLYIERKQGDTSLDRYDYNESLACGINKIPAKAIRGEEPLPYGKRLRLQTLLSDGESKQQVPFIFQNEDFMPRSGKHWKTEPTVNMQRLVKSNRIFKQGSSPWYKRYVIDFPVIPLGDRWESMQIGTELNYVVQTANKVIERCMLMTTDPGDIVLDPTCGSGTTAFVAEKWGRRWITCDTSRVAVTLAKQRLLTSTYDYFELAHPEEGVSSGFVYKTVPHITLKSIAHNEEIDRIYDEYIADIQIELGSINKLLNKNWQEWEVPFDELYDWGEDAVIALKQYHALKKSHEADVEERSKNGATLSDLEMLDHNYENQKSNFLKAINKATKKKLTEEELPFEEYLDWPDEAIRHFKRFHQRRMERQSRIDESIAKNAPQETMYDQPKIDKKKVRVTGPFTVEAVPAPVSGPFTTDGTPASTARPLEEMEEEPASDESVARSGETARQSDWRDELLKTGIRGKGGQMIEFVRVEALSGTKYLHAEAETKGDGQMAVISFGPEHAPLEQRQVALAIDEASNFYPKPKMLLFATFQFDPEASKDIDEIPTDRLGMALLKVQMNGDLLTDDLKKKRSSNESFWLIGQPDVELLKDNDGQFRIQVNGFDYYDTKTGKVLSGDSSHIAMWMLDPDYDNRSLFPKQVFFPMAGTQDGWAKMAKSLKEEVDQSLVRDYHGTTSLPFEIGGYKQAAVKIIDDRGIESLKIIALD